MLADVEARVEQLERLVNDLTASLEDPALYARDGGAGEAQSLGRELERVKRELDDALEQWSTATDAVERLTST